DFREHGGVPVLEAVDQVQLPQRPRTVEWSREDARHLLGQLLLATWRRQRDLAYVEVEVEVRVVDPVRVVEPEGHLDELPLERWKQWKPVPEQPFDVATAQRFARPGARIENGQA